MTNAEKQRQSLLDFVNNSSNADLDNIVDSLLNTVITDKQFNERTLAELHYLSCTNCKQKYGITPNCSIEHCNELHNKWWTEQTETVQQHDSRVDKHKA